MTGRSRSGWKSIEHERAFVWRNPALVPAGGPGPMSPGFTGADALRDLKAVFEQGRVLALPTETVYGLAAPIDRPDLIERVFELKGRPPDNPLIVHVATQAQARQCVSDWPELADRLAGQFWPGPLTLVLPRSKRISDRITAGRDTVAVRMPDHPVALAVLRSVGVPLVAPSANLFTRLSPTTAEDVCAVFGPEDVEVVDGGPCRVGIESTILQIDSSARTATWLRPGMIDRSQVEALLPAGWRIRTGDESTSSGPGQSAPGQMKEHYRPARPLTVCLYADERDRAQRLAGLGQDCVPVELPADAVSAARVLYGKLRAAETGRGERIALLLPAAVLASSEWEGVLNRLRKAATSWQV